VSQPEPCPECKGKCCWDECGYRIEHMAAEFYEHVCDACLDGDKYVAPNRLYLLTQTHNRRYDTYDSCVVCAPDREAARRVHPKGEEYTYERDSWGKRGASSGFWFEDRSWAPPEHVVAVELGVANEALQPGVVCASFNAG
jgi:hypothetical protein